MAVLQSKLSIPQVDLAARVRELEAQLAAEKARKTKALTLKVGPSGTVCLYGMGRYPVALYASQWERLFTAIDDIKAFIAEHGEELARKAPAA